MKILVSAYACDPTRGSENKTSWSWYEYYLKQGHEVWLLTMPWGKEGLEKTLSELNYPNAHVEYVKMPKWVEKRHQQRKGSLWLYLHYIIFQRIVYRQAKKLDKKHDFDVTHHVSWTNAQMGSGLCRLKKPLIFGPVGGGQFPPPGFESYFESGWEKEEKRRKVSDLLLKYYPDSKRTLRKASLVLAVNQETYDLAKANGATRVEYFLDASFDLNYLSPRSSHDPNPAVFRLIWVGRILPRKGLPFTFEALSKIPDSVPFHLDVFGDGELGHRVPDWLKKYQMEDRVTWHGQVPWKTVLDAYQEADVFLFNSLRDTFGVQLIEAMTAGIPLVCLDLHGAATFVPEEAAIKVPVTNPEETAQRMAEAITRLYQNPELRVKMGQAGHEYATQQGLAYKSKQVETYLREITGKDTPLLANTGSN